MRCLSCQYDLSNLTEHRCPECSRAFDPNDPNTFARLDEAFLNGEIAPGLRGGLIAVAIVFLGGIALLILIALWASEA